MSNMTAAKDAWDALLQSNAALASRVRGLERFEAEASIQIQILTGRMLDLEETQKEAERDEYVDLRRTLLVVGLTEILTDQGTRDPSGYSSGAWERACAEVYRRYGHLTAAGKPLWTKPPKAPSDETKRLIAETLKRRQEA